MPPYAYFNKQFLPLAEAKVGVMTHALHYGTACFEGIRGNWNSQEKQAYLFRTRDHYVRLLQSCQILKIVIPHGVDELCRLTEELVQMCGYQEDVYIRPLAYKSSEALGVRLHNLEDDFLVFVTPFPAYLDTDKGARCCVSSWRRIDDNMIPPRAKITGLYVNSALAKTEAVERGFDEAIMLTHEGHVSEGSGENIFLVIQGKLVTPLASDNILVGYLLRQPPTPASPHQPLPVFGAIHNPSSPLPPISTNSNGNSMVTGLVTLIRISWMHLLLIIFCTDRDSNFPLSL